MKNLTYKLILSLFFVALTVFTSRNTVYAQYGGGGEVEYKFRIEKDVKLEGDESFKDKIFVNLNDTLEKGKQIIFRIKVKNLSDEEVDDMDMKDILPDELEKIGGSGLTEGWNDFKIDETKEFQIQVEIKDSEKDRSGDFEKCVVNKAELRWDGDYEGSDTATVCYGNIPVKELPVTGFAPVNVALGLGLTVLGVLTKRLVKFVK
jgi:hypothetical protein